MQHFCLMFDQHVWKYLLANLPWPKSTKLQHLLLLSDNGFWYLFLHCQNNGLFSCGCNQFGISGNCRIKNELQNACRHKVKNYFLCFAYIFFGKFWSWNFLAQSARKLAMVMTSVEKAVYWENNIWFHLQANTRQIWALASNSHLSTWSVCFASKETYVVAKSLFSSNFNNRKPKKRFTGNSEYFGRLMISCKENPNSGICLEQPKQDMVDDWQSACKCPLTAGQ